MILLYAINYRVGYREIISPFCFYYFGQLWDGEGDGEDILESGVIYIKQNGYEYGVNFRVNHQKEENINDTMVYVTSIDIYVLSNV